MKHGCAGLLITRMKHEWKRSIDMQSRLDLLVVDLSPSGWLISVCYFYANLLG